MGEIPGNTVGGKAAIGPLAFWLLSIVDQPPSPKTAAGERTANLVKITHTTTAELSSHPCKPSSYTGGVWWGRCRRRISILGPTRLEKQQPLTWPIRLTEGTSRYRLDPHILPFLLLNQHFPMPTWFMIHQPELGIPLVQAYRSTRPGKLGLGQRECVGSWSGWSVADGAWWSFAGLC